MIKPGLVLTLLAGLTLAGCGGGGSTGQAPTPLPQVSQAEFSQGLPLKSVGFGGNTIAQAASNVVPVSIAAKNLMLVAVTVCRPSTATCVTVDKVMLDTGSVGLRLYAPAVQNALAPVAGSSTAECGIFGSFYTWGPLREADVRLGALQASNIRVQLYGDGSVPAASAVGCGDSSSGRLADPLPSKTGFNGILGVKGLQADSQSYYSCSTASCSAVTLTMAEKLPNPVSKLPIDANGYSIQMPSIPESGANGVAGAFVLGVGTRPNNSLPATVTTIPLDSNQGFQLWMGGVAATALVDSGTGVYALPKAQGLSLPTCAGPEAAVYCPANPMSLAILMKPSFSPTAVVGTNLTIGDGAAFLSNSMVASSTVATAVPATVSSFGVDALLGVPFFFGRNIYFGIEGQPVSTGGAPSAQAFVAF